MPEVHLMKYGVGVLSQTLPHAKTATVSWSNIDLLSWSNIDLWKWIFSWDKTEIRWKCSYGFITIDYRGVPLHLMLLFLSLGLFINVINKLVTCLFLLPIISCVSWLCLWEFMSVRNFDHKPLMEPVWMGIGYLWFPFRSEESRMMIMMIQITVPPWFCSHFGTWFHYVQISQKGFLSW